MILNLKRVNSHVVHHYFKMDTLLSAMAMMRPNCFIVSIDLKMLTTQFLFTLRTINILNFNGILNTTNTLVLQMVMVLSKTIY